MANPPVSKESPGEKGGTSIPAASCQKVVDVQASCNPESLTLDPTTIAFNLEDCPDGVAVEFKLVGDGSVTLNINTYEGSGTPGPVTSTGGTLSAANPSLSVTAMDEGWIDVEATLVCLRAQASQQRTAKTVIMIDP